MRDSSSARERICGIVAREHERLYAVADEDPAQAIAEARQLNASPDLNEINLNGSRNTIKRIAIVTVFEVSSHKDASPSFNYMQESKISSAWFFLLPLTTHNRYSRSAAFRRPIFNLECPFLDL